MTNELLRPTRSYRLRVALPLSLSLARGVRGGSDRVRIEPGHERILSSDSWPGKQINTLGLRLIGPVFPCEGLTVMELACREAQSDEVIRSR